jgi:very-short-patch-repair endonuclease
MRTLYRPKTKTLGREPAPDKCQTLIRSADMPTYNSKEEEASPRLKHLGDASRIALGKSIDIGTRDAPGKFVTAFEMGVDRLTKGAAERGHPPGMIETIRNTAWQQGCKASDLCESPIERTMAAGLVTANWREFPSVLLVHDASKDSKDGLLPDYPLILVPQLALVRYRLDFGLVAQRGVNQMRQIFAVECDGQEYHQDATADRIRNGYLASWGVLTFRFSGKRISDDAASCADEVATKLSQWKAGDDF